MADQWTEIFEFIQYARNEMDLLEDSHMHHAIQALANAVERLATEQQNSGRPVGSAVVLYFGGWRELPEANGWGPRYTKIDIVKSIRFRANISLKEAKDLFEAACGSHPSEIVCPSSDAAQALVYDLRALGGTAELQK